MGDATGRAEGWASEAVAAAYEAWYETPLGRLVDRLGEEGGFALRAGVAGGGCERAALPRGRVRPGDGDSRSRVRAGSARRARRGAAGAQARWTPRRRDPQSHRALDALAAAQAPVRALDLARGEVSAPGRAGRSPASARVHGAPVDEGRARAAPRPRAGTPLARTMGSGGSSLHARAGDVRGRGGAPPIGKSTDDGRWGRRDGRCGTVASIPRQNCAGTHRKGGVLVWYAVCGASRPDRVTGKVEDRTNRQLILLRWVAILSVTATVLVSSALGVVRER